MSGQPNASRRIWSTRPRRLTVPVERNAKKKHQPAFLALCGYNAGLVIHMYVATGFVFVAVAVGNPLVKTTVIGRVQASHHETRHETRH